MSASRPLHNATHAVVVMLLSIFLMGSTCVVRASGGDSDHDSDSDRHSKKDKDGTSVVVVVDTRPDDGNSGSGDSLVGGGPSGGLSAGIPNTAMAYDTEERAPEVAIPEPAALLMFAAGALALASRRRGPPR